jgi:hypothetical protein
MTVHERPRMKDSEDGWLALIILGIILTLVAIGGAYLYKNKHLLGGQQRAKAAPFSPPPDRQAYLEGKEKLDPNNPNDFEELKKLLMRRAVNTIPIILSLQNDGNSIERLYKKGMLTDDMHFRVAEIKTFVDAEYQDVQAEADQFKEGWGQDIWPQAMQFFQMRMKQLEEQKAQEAAGGPRPNSTSPGPGSPMMQKLPSGNNVMLSPAQAAGLEAAKAKRAEELQAQLLAEEESERKSGGSGMKKKK